MAKVTYVCGNQSTTAHTDNPLFLLKNIGGDFLSLGNPNTSNYNGYFVRIGESYFKTLFNILPIENSCFLQGLQDHGHKQIGNDCEEVSRPHCVFSGSSSLKDVMLDGKSVTRSYSLNGIEMQQKYYLLDEGLIVDLRGAFEMVFDCKRLFDESDLGRIYSISADPAEGSFSDGKKITVITVSYSKYSDGSCSKKDYGLHAVMVTDMDLHSIDETITGKPGRDHDGIMLKGEWTKINYSYDDYRGTRNTPWVHDSFRLCGNGSVVISAADDEESARRSAISLFLEKDRLIKEHSFRREADSLIAPMNAQLAWRALEVLFLRQGIYAGLPWFFQQWSRDEIISYGGLLSAKRYAQLLPMIDKWFGVLHSDGTLPAMYPDKGLPSSDAPGWLGKRTRDLIVALASDNLSHMLPRDLIIRWRDATGRMIDDCASRMRDGLIHSDYNTTWMDTSHSDNGRQGFCIEIQALFLALCDAHAHLCVMTRTAVEHSRAELARTVLNNTRSKMFRDGILYDMLFEDSTPDPTVRPNAFIAWYVAPNMFTKDEWNIIFSRMVPQLWLEWGGLSSIGIHDRNFHPQYTGEDVASYHRGDSWYFVNNIAAMALLQVNPEEYSAKARAIAQASLRDLLEQGFAGCSSEISSAGSQVAGGCYAQAWSAATLLELLMKLDSAR